MRPRIPHDRLFKELLGTFLYEFLELFLPELAERVDPSSLTMIDKELFPEGEPERRADLVVQARIRGEDRGSAFLIHLEHEAQNRAPRLFPRRMLQYALHLHDATGWAVYPIALLSYSKPRRELTDRFCLQCAGFESLNFRYRLIQLNRLDWRSYARVANPIAAALMSRMGIEVQDRPLVKLACLRLLGQLSLGESQSRLVGRFFENYLRLEPEEEERFHQEFDKIEPKERAIMLEYTTSWHEKGWESGRAAGLEAGLEEGREVGRVLGREEGREEGREQGREQGREEGREEGREVGREEGRLEVARRLLGMGLSSEQIQQATDLSLERIEALRAESPQADR